MPVQVRGHEATGAWPVKIRSPYPDRKGGVHYVPEPSQNDWGTPLDNGNVWILPVIHLSIRLDR